jgi:hypothetical protein
MKHLAHLTHSVKQSDAMELLTQARRLAEKGGHEDVRHHIIISEVRLAAIGKELSAHAAEYAFERMQGVEDYAKLMAAPALECDALLVRAEVLTQQGEAGTAGSLLIRAMAIARRNAMALRLNRAITNYAETLRMRGRDEAAMRLLASSLELAKRNSYNVEVARIRRRFAALKYGNENGQS